MKRKATVSVTVIAVTALVVLGAWWKWSLWAECRATNSWLYCAHVVGGK